MMLQHFLLLPHPTILAHKSALSASLAPQIDQLIARAESLVESESGRLQRLEERLQILQSAKLPVVEGGVRHPGTFVGEGEREGGEGRGAQMKDGNDGGSRLEGLDPKELNPAQRRKVAMLRGKRERLEKERAALAGS
jgi:DASH complex subunit SPC19